MAVKKMRGKSRKIDLFKQYVCTTPLTANFLNTTLKTFLMKDYFNGIARRMNTIYSTQLILSVEKSACKS